MPTLPHILSQIWHLLSQGAEPSRHPFHTPVLASLDGSQPVMRTVILRDVQPEKRLLIAHSDIRSSKIKQIRQTPQVSWLFYNAESQIQLRLRGLAQIHHDDTLADEQWAATPLSSRRNYLTVREPDTVLAEYQSNLPEFLQNREPTLAESEAGRAYFAIIAAEIAEIEWLKLAYTGHQRARFSWKNGDWFGEWLAA